MKSLSIKLKITLYFTLIMFLLASIQLISMASVYKNVAKNELYDTLVTNTNTVYDQIHYERPAMEDAPHQGQNRPEGDKKPPSGKPVASPLIIPEDVSYVIGDVYIAVFQTTGEGEGTTQYGSLPEGLSLDLESAKNDKKTTLSNNTDNYYAYTKFIKDPASKDNGTWVVGVINAKLSYTLTHSTLRMVLFSIPIIIIIAALLGYAITKRAFRPVSDITKAAAEIAGSNDLSRRINLKSGKDEISNLANTFDGMLDTIQSNYEREKQFTDDASHELRTPVAVILAQSELAMSSNATDEDVKESLTIINKQSLKMKKLLSELLTLARADNNQTVLDKETFDLNELAEMVLEEESYISQRKSISVSLLTSEAVEVFADRTAIMRVIINFVNNAIKYGKDGGFVEIEVKRVGDSGARCTVRDNGIGISEADLNKIWDRFFRVDASRTNDGYSSNGLGLPIVKSIIEAHGGTVNAKSVLGEGSVFEFTI